MAIGGDGATLWDSITKYVSVVETIGGGGDGDFGAGVGGLKTTVAKKVIGAVKDKVADQIKKKVGINLPNKGTATGDVGGKVPEDDPSCQSKGVTNEGVTKSARWKGIINGAMLALNVSTSLKMAKLQRDIGKAYLSLAEEQRGYYNDRYKPLEKDLTDEALKLKKYNRNKEKLHTGQMLISARGATAGKLDKALSCTGRYCTGQRASIITDQLIEQSAVESLTAGFAHRYTDKDEITHNNLRWEKREQVLKIGRDIPTQAVSYASMSAGIFGSIGRQAGVASEGIVGFLAYGRGDTVYPERRDPISYSNYYFKPTQIELPTITRPNYKKAPEPETKISVSG